MTIAAIHQTSTLTRERYEEVVFRLTGKRRAETPSDFPFGGLLVHVAAEDPRGFLVFDVWESEEAVDEFRAAIESIPQAVGIEEPPRFFPIHTFIAEDAKAALERNKDVVRRHYQELFNERRLEIAGDLTADDYVEHGIAAFADRVGDRPDPVEGLRETVRWLTAAFPDLHIAVDDLVAEGDKVVAYITMRGTHEGEFQGIAPTGRSFEAKAMHLFRLRGGKAVEHWAVRDDLGMVLQLGLRVVPDDDSAPVRPG